MNVTHAAVCVRMGGNKIHAQNASKAPKRATIIANYTNLYGNDAELLKAVFANIFAYQRHLLSLLGLWVMV